MINPNASFKDDPRDFALSLVEKGTTTDAHLLMCCIKFMSPENVAKMLKKNELNPIECQGCDAELERYGDHNNYCLSLIHI